ncbi:hypothetical protein [Sulfurospirillum multivorans]|uniref:hypothetical protein n=1 Tax=Sulfurospirillum multivorans TaxID=66821 RepID=UPI00046CE5DB|nr:hypothetical protein [Sulfurospirillum multivorans]
MAHMIRVTRNKFNDEGTMEVDDFISINADNINIIEDSHLDSREKSRIIFNDGTSIYIIESRVELETLIDG